jgi:hypothetical protein
MSKDTAIMAVCVFGSRSFHDYEVLKNTLQNLYPGTIAIISGKAKGTDELGERYGDEFGLDVRARKPDYRRYGQGAPSVRNEEMAKECNEAVGFWDGKSTGTKHMIKCLMRERKPFNIYRFDGSLLEHKTFKVLHKPGCPAFVFIRESEGWGHCGTHAKHTYLDPDDSLCLCDFCIEVDGTRKLQRERFDFSSNEVVVLKGHIRGKLTPLAPLVDIHKAMTTTEDEAHACDREFIDGECQHLDCYPSCPIKDTTAPNDPERIERSPAESKAPNIPARGALPLVEGNTTSLTRSGKAESPPAATVKKKKPAPNTPPKKKTRSLLDFT